MFNLSRIVGQTFGIAVVGSLITEREKYHSALLVDSINNANSASETLLRASDEDEDEPERARPGGLLALILSPARMLLALMRR